MRTFDMFCGGGGSSLGARQAGATIVGGAEIGDFEGATYRRNFPTAKLYGGDLRKLRTRVLRDELGPIDLLLTSPECTNHTCAKGSAPRSEESKETALQVLRFAEALNPRWIILENVVHMRPWPRYLELKSELRRLGYDLHESVLDSADFGVPQRRRRLFLVADRFGPVPQLASSTIMAPSARSILDPVGAWTSRPLFSPKRAIDTLARAERAMRDLGRREAFLIVYYGTDGAGGWQTLDAPLRTVTTIDRFALVEPHAAGHTIRMLQPSELRRAMGFPASFLFSDGTRREKIRVLGNAVCPPVMKKLVHTLARAAGS